jgi:site-specific recombinase XerD
VEPKASNRANPIASTLSTVHGYPDRLKIYRIPASEFWWVRATFGERRIKRSTKETDRPKAVKYAKAFYEELLRNNGVVPLKTSKSFERCADALLDEHRQKASSGERNERFADDLRKQLTHRIKPFFSSYSLKEINYDALNRFVTAMRSDGCSASTIQRNLVSVRQVLKLGNRSGLIDALPIFPSVSQRDNPRPWFSPAEYELLKRVADEEVKKRIVVHRELLTEEARDFLLFMVNTFLRPSDWYQLKRRQISVQQRGNGDEPLLVISPSSSKTVNTQIVTMPTAVNVYKNIIARQDEAIKADAKDAFAWTRAKPEQYVFLPHIANRNRAKDVMRRFFDHFVRAAGLKTSHAGAGRTIYSLRHTAIAFRLLKGDNVDLLFLARNCRTSVDMLDRFYCRHLSALMAPEKIVGMKAKTRRVSKPKSASKKKTETDE